MLLITFLALFFVRLLKADDAYYCLNDPPTVDNTNCGTGVSISCTDEVQKYCCCCTDPTEYGSCSIAATTTISPDDAGGQVESCLDSNTTWDFDGIKDEGSSPGFKMYLTCNGKDYFVKFQFPSIKELDSSGKSTVNDVSSLASSSNSWSWVGPYSTNTTESYALTGTVTPKKASHSAGLTINTTLAKKELTVEYGNTTIIVPQNAVKWSISISDWEFSSNAEYLYLEIKVGTGGGNSKSFTYDTNGDNQVTVDDWVAIDLQTLVELKNSSGDVTGTDNATITYKNKGSNGYFIYYQFNKFDYAVYLDPTVQTTTSSNSGFSKSSGCYLSILIALFLRIIL